MKKKTYLLSQDEVSRLETELLYLKNPKKSPSLSRFFKTGKGEYGEGDLFLGITVPVLRKISKKYYNSIHYKDLSSILYHKYHEIRFVGFILLVLNYEKEKNPKSKSEIAKFYIQHKKGLNNWDLVDVTAHKILGPELFSKEKTLLYTYAKSKDLWENRIAILTTFHFIRLFQFEDTLQISRLLLTHPHDLIHKAVGWMLRELGKRDPDLLRSFLQENSIHMPRTMLRYSIEKFSKTERMKFLQAPFRG
jgi:3-methyladenine DNA glycosylase AlkD